MGEGHSERCLKEKRARTWARRGGGGTLWAGKLSEKSNGATTRSAKLTEERGRYLKNKERGQRKLKKEHFK